MVEFRVLVLLQWDPSWDCPGPMTQTVEDAALLLKYIAGHDPRDATTYTDAVPDYHAHLAIQTTYHWYS